MSKFLYALINIFAWALITIPSCYSIMDLEYWAMFVGVVVLIVNNALITRWANG